MKEEIKVQYSVHDLDEGGYLGQVAIIIAEFIHPEESVVEDACHMYAQNYHNLKNPKTKGQYGAELDD